MSLKFEDTNIQIYLVFIFLFGVNKYPNLFYKKKYIIVNELCRITK